MHESRRPRPPCASLVPRLLRARWRTAVHKNDTGPARAVLVNGCAHPSLEHEKPTHVPGDVPGDAHHTLGQITQVMGDFSTTLLKGGRLVLRVERVECIWSIHLERVMTGPIATALLVVCPTPPATVAG